MKKIALILSLFTCAFLNAQDNFEGTIVKTMTYDNMSPEMKAYASMLPSESIVTIDHNLSKSVTATGMGETIILSDAETGETISLINQAGQMIGVRTNINDESEKEEEPEIEYLDEEKEILGYKCKKAIVATDDIEMVVYYTDELPDLESANTKLAEIEGFIMEMVMSTEQFTVTTSVSEIKEEKVKKIKMQIPAEYKEMTKEEIKAMQQGGGGM
ncbi:MAG: hypothetical protein RJQ00_04215 [Vicingaceae bacterium]